MRNLVFCSGQTWVTLSKTQALVPLGGSNFGGVLPVAGAHVRNHWDLWHLLGGLGQLLPPSIALTSPVSVTPPRALVSQVSDTALRPPAHLQGILPGPGRTPCGVSRLPSLLFRGVFLSGERDPVAHTPLPPLPGLALSSEMSQPLVPLL